MRVKPITEAYIRCEVARNFLRDLPARCMEATEDKAGILWERWVVVKDGPDRNTCMNLYLYATPHGWDISLTASADNDTDATFAAIRAVISKL